MKLATIITIMDSINNDLNNTYKEILNGKHYKQYMLDLLEAQYDLMEYTNNIGVTNYVIEYAKAQDRIEYKALYE